MTFQPIVPFGGYSGWLFMQRTLENQQTAFNDSVAVKRATEYFRENIGDVTTAEQLVEDRRLREVALGAFGLDEDIDNKFFIQKILEEGVDDDQDLANRLADPRYAAFAEAFSFNFGLPLTTVDSRAESIIDRFETRQFERAVGNINGDFRLALNLDSALTDIVDTVEDNDARWFSIMGNAPLREVVQTALGLPSAIAAVDLDQQLTTFKERAESVFGTSDVGELTDPEQQDDMIRLFLIRSEAASFNASLSSGSVALSLLQSSGF